MGFMANSPNVNKYGSNFIINKDGKLTAIKKCKKCGINKPYCECKND